MSTARTSNPTTIPGISTPPADVSPALRKYLETLAETIEIRLGRRGDPRDRAITLRELIDSGLATELAGRPFNPNTGGGPTFEPPYDSTVPPTPTGFTANGGYALVTLFWDYPKYGPHAHTEIWRNSANIIGDAQLVGISSGLSFVDPVGEGASFYYWIRHVSASEVYGPFNSANGTLAQTALNVTLLLATLNGAITESQLTQALGSRINLIDASALTVNSVAYRVAQEATARSTAISNEAAARAAAITSAVDTLQAQINDLSAIAEYNNSTAYVTGELVTYNGFLYKAKSATTGNLPTNTTYWELLGEYSSLADIVDQNAASIVQINTINATSTSAASQAIQSVTATVNNPTTGVVATSSALGALTTRVSTAEGNIVSNSSAITSLNNAVTSPTTGLATKASSSALSALDSRVTAAEGVNTSQSTSLTSLQNTIDHPTTGLAAKASSTALSALDSRVTTAEGTVASQGTSITNLNNTINHPTTGLAAKASSSALSALDSRVSSAEGTISSQGTSITNLNNTINHPTTGLATRASSTALSALTSRVTATEETNTSQSDSITTLGNTVNDPTTGLSTRASSTALSALTSRVTATEETNTSQSGAITTLGNTVNHPTTGLATRASSTALTALTSRVSSTEEDITAQSELITALGTTVNNPTTGLVATSNAVSLLRSEIFPNGTAEASYIDQVNAAVGANASAIQAEATARAEADGTLFGQYTVKVDLNGYVSGFGLASTVNNAAPFSEFTVRADRFAIASPAPPVGSRVITPFVVQTTTQVINGITVPAGVFMDAAFIKNGTITNVKIGLGEIDNARIANLSADKINAGRLNAAYIAIDNTVLDTYFDPSINQERLYIPNARINNAQIKDLAVTTGKINDLAVSTLKIAGNAITQPEVYTAGDVYIPNNSSAAIQLTNSGVAENYNFVGAGNGDYEYQLIYIDPEFGFAQYDYVYVGPNNGDYVRVLVYSAPTFTNAITVIETPTVTVGVDATAAVQIVYYGTHDGSIYTFNDSGQHLFMLLDTGSGYRLVAQQQVGLRTDSSADTMASLPIAMTFTARNITTARVKILTGSRRVDLPMGNFSNACWLRNSTISLLGAKR